MVRIIVMKNKLALSIALLALTLVFGCRFIDFPHARLRLFHNFLTIKHTLVSDHRRPNLSAAFRAVEDALASRAINVLEMTPDALTIVKRERERFPMKMLIPFPRGCQFMRKLIDYEGQTVEIYWLDYRYTSNNWNSNHILLYLHGGGYILGDFQGFSGFACHLSRFFNVTVIYLEYRLVPEHPLPATVDDVVVLYRALLRDGFSASQLTIFGDSAGGGLALLTVQALLSHQLPKPAAVVTLSPWADLSLSGDSHTRNRRTELLIPVTVISSSTALILGGHLSRLNRNDSRYSPLFGSFEHFPPMYVSVGKTEILEDDGRRVAEKARRQGVDVTLVAGEHMIHVYPIFFSYFREAKEAMEDIVRWWSDRCVR